MTSTPFTDRPIKGAAEDEFGRELFAKSLAGALSAATLGGGLVVALEGEWGSGKTSVLNMVQMSLEQMEPLPLVIRFDPWLISGSESLIESFLVQLAAELGQTPKCEQASKVANRLLRFAKLLTPVKLIPGVEPWGSLVQKAVEVTEKATEGVSSALGALGVP
jgi:predicted KAP-like P-loop ATPase